LSFARLSQLEKSEQKGEILIGFINNKNQTFSQARKWKSYFVISISSSMGRNGPKSYPFQRIYAIEKSVHENHTIFYNINREFLAGILHMLKFEILH
jgi:hypothetical protein